MSVLVYLEHAGGVVDEPSLQAAALARSLADAGGTTVAAILASDTASEEVENAPAVDALHVAVHEAYASYAPRAVAEAPGLRALEAAFEAGVAWLDLAPLYGGGRAEEIAARFLKGRRDAVQVCSKVGLAPMSIRNYLISLKTALAWAVEQKLLPALPKFPKVKVPKKKPQPIPAESFERLLGKAPDELWRAYLLCGWSGELRLSEALFLEWEPSESQPWADFAANRIVLPAVFAKSDEDQWVPLHPVLREALERLPRTGKRVFPFRSRKGGGPLSRNAVTNRVLVMAKRAGVKLSMHKLRKGFGCRAAKTLGW